MRFSNVNDARQGVLNWLRKMPTLKNQQMINVTDQHLQLRFAQIGAAHLHHRLVKSHRRRTNNECENKPHQATENKSRDS